jgi:hypothetical protein
VIVDADEKIEHIKTTNAILKNLEKQLAEGKKKFWNQINSCGKEKNFVPFAQCNKCWNDCRGNKSEYCDCDNFESLQISSKNDYTEIFVVLHLIYNFIIKDSGSHLERSER